MFRKTDKLIGDEDQNIQAKKQDILVDASNTDSANRIDRNIENLLTIANLAKSKRPKLAKSKNSDLPKANFTKVNSSGMDFLTPKARKTFIHL